MHYPSLAVLLLAAATMFSTSQIAQAHPEKEGTVFRRANFDNEFETKTPEGINARGHAEVKTKDSRHHVKIHVNGLLPGETYVIINHWFEPIPERGVPRSSDAVPSCTGHFQFLGEPVKADRKGRLRVDVKVDQLAPHIWVANLAKFMEVTDDFQHAPVSADAFVDGGLLVPFADIVAAEDEFVDHGRLIMEGPDSNCDPVAR